jgi:hypothetical protein
MKLGTFLDTSSNHDISIARGVKIHKYKIIAKGCILRSESINHRAGSGNDVFFVSQNWHFSFLTLNWDCKISNHRFDFEIYKILSRLRNTVGIIDNECCIILSYL